MREKIKKVREFFSDESGQGMVEYMLIIGLIVFFILVALYIFRNAISNFITKISTTLDSEAPTLK